MKSAKVIGILLVIAVAIGAAYYFLIYKKKDTAQKTTNTVADDVLNVSSGAPFSPVVVPVRPKLTDVVATPATNTTLSLDNGTGLHTPTAAATLNIENSIAS